jgi:ABC-2 type transport system ATP-binding protein
VIEVTGLVKQFDAHRAIDGITFTVREGDVFGFIGPNGAGKTTTMRVIATLLEPTAGDARVCGVSAVEEPERVRPLVGFMPDYYGPYEGVTVEEYLAFFAAAYGLPRRQRGRIVHDVMELTDLGALAKKLVASMSKGMKQRLCLAKTLVHDPKVLVLDEPAAGLDPRARIELRALLKELQRIGKTIIISSHILTELADVCNTVGIIEQGKLLAQGDIESIRRALLPHRVITLRVLGGDAAIARAVAIARENPHVTDPQVGGDGTLRLTWTGEEEGVAGLLRAVVNGGVDVVGLVEEKANLEHLFMQITQGAVA